jgi:hypothetical protein
VGVFVLYIQYECAFDVRRDKNLRVEKINLFPSWSSDAFCGEINEAAFS